MEAAERKHHSLSARMEVLGPTALRSIPGLLLTGMQTLACPLLHETRLKHQEKNPDNSSFEGEDFLSEIVNFSISSQVC